MQMSAENLDDIPFTELDSRTRHALAHEPIAPEESGGPAIERVSDHVGVDDGEFGEDGQAAAKDAGVVEFPVGKDGVREVADAEVVFLGPAFLKPDDFWRGVEG